MSSFELVRGYSLSIMGMLKTRISNELLMVHQEEVARRALKFSGNPMCEKPLVRMTPQRGTRCTFSRKGQMQAPGKLVS